MCDGNLKECRQESSDLSQPDSFFCSQNGRLCQEMEGDCDNDNECAGSLKCGADNCESTYPSNYDCCYLPGDVVDNKQVPLSMQETINVNVIQNLSCV